MIRSSRWLLTTGLFGSVTLALSMTVQAQGPRAPAAPAPRPRAERGLVGCRRAVCVRGVEDRRGGARARASARQARRAWGSRRCWLRFGRARGVCEQRARAADCGARVWRAARPQDDRLLRRHRRPEQLAALAALKVEADTYEKGAIDYSDTVTKIVKLHYQEKKKEILSSLDREITIEKAELKKARDIAIARLEEFVLKYSGSNAQPEETPDAMYRLAALYEERARDSDAPDDITIGLKPAIGLSNRIIIELPKYPRRAAIYSSPGHAYNDSNRTDEAQQVWRSLVCHNRFPYPTAMDPKKPDSDTILPLPQDHDEAYWSEWRRAHHDEKSLKRGGPDTTYTDPYADCQAVAQPDILPGEDPKYVPEIWWQIGNWEFDQQDLGGGYVKEEPGAVYDYNRAASAYLHSLKYN